MSEPASNQEQQAEQTAETSESQQAAPDFFDIVREGNRSKIIARLSQDVASVLAAPQLKDFLLLSLADDGGSIGTWHLTQIADVVLESFSQKDILIFLSSRGGSIEPAYQIAKLCKSRAKGRFVVAVPRYAKSAATLLALGADEIHMGPLGELGPIDPQLGGLPALGISEALRRVAAVAQEIPGSADMLAKYLASTLRVDQIGYCDRITESAVQYAERLLGSKIENVAAVARQLVYGYKDHSFVIDPDEATRLLGGTLVKKNTAIAAVAGAYFSILNNANLALSVFQKHRCLHVGSASDDPMIWATQS